MNATSSGLSATDVAKSSGNWGVAYYLIGKAWGKDWTGEKNVSPYAAARQECERIGMRLPTTNQLLKAHQAGFGRSYLNQSLWTSDEAGGEVKIVNVTTGIVGSVPISSSGVLEAYRCISKSADNQEAKLATVIPLGNSPNYFLLRFFATHGQALAACKASGGRLPTRQDALDIQKKGLWRDLYAITSVGYFFLDEVFGDGRVYIANLSNTGELTIDVGNAMLQPLCVR